MCALTSCDFECKRDVSVRRVPIEFCIPISYHFNLMLSTYRNTVHRFLRKLQN